MTEVNILIEDALIPGVTKTIKTIHISGQLDESNIDEKIKEIYKLLEVNPKDLNLIFDFENLSYMNSKSIGYLTDLYAKITENNGLIAISGAKSNIADILQVVGLTQLIKSFESYEEAKQYISTTGAAANLAGISQTTGPTTAEVKPPAA